MGRDVLLTAEHNPHDVAALLKEFFRDLPDPLLTRDLYSAFVATCSKLDWSCRLSCLFSNSFVNLKPQRNKDVRVS